MTIAIACLSACDAEPIVWEAPRAVAWTIDSASALEISADGRPALQRRTLPSAPVAEGMCRGSVAYARDRDQSWYAAWWSARADGAVTLQVARSDDAGARWMSPVVADSRDRGRRGCQRPPPAIAADSASGYVHVAYFLEPSEGAGIWFTHSMERGALWHQTVGVIYGEDPARTSVAASGDTVLVAYEHPGSGGRRIGLAISRTAGHSFEERLRVVRAGIAAFHPLVGYRAGLVALAWRETGDQGASPTMLRVGRLRKGSSRHESN